MAKKEVYSKAMKAIHKSADEMYGKEAVNAAEKGEFGRAEELVENIKDKKLAGEIYGKAAMNALEKGRFGVAGEFAEKAEEYLKQNHPDILIDIYEGTGEAIKAKDLRKRLETKSKKK